MSLELWEIIPLSFELNSGQTFVSEVMSIVLVCGNTMCYLNYREAEVQVLKRT